MNEEELRTLIRARLELNRYLTIKAGGTINFELPSDQTQTFIRDLDAIISAHRPQSRPSRPLPSQRNQGDSSW